MMRVFGRPVCNGLPRSNFARWRQASRGSSLRHHRPKWLRLRINDVKDDAELIRINEDEELMLAVGLEAKPSDVEDVIGGDRCVRRVFPCQCDASFSAADLLTVRAE